MIITELRFSTCSVHHSAFALIVSSIFIAKRTFRHEAINRLFIIDIFYLIYWISLSYLPCWGVWGCQPPRPVCKTGVAVGRNRGGFDSHCPSPKYYQEACMEEIRQAGIMVLLSGLLVGVLFGFVLQRGRYCMNSAFRDIIFVNDFTLFRSYVTPKW